MPKRTNAPSYLETIVNELLAKYRKLDSIIGHAPTKGTYHEKILRQVIKDLLPNTYSTGEGFLINKDSKVSSQLDILIVDNLDPRSFNFRDEDFFIASDTAVTCIGEVKSYATKKDFISSFHKLVDAKMLITDMPAIPTSFIFCYDAYASAETFAGWVDAAISSYPNRNISRMWHYPDYVFCLQKNVFNLRREIPSRSSLPGQSFQYWHALSASATPAIIKQKMVQELFQCVINGAGRMRNYQGIKLQRPFSN